MEDFEKRRDKQQQTLKYCDRIAKEGSDESFSGREATGDITVKGNLTFRQEFQKNSNFRQNFR